MKNGIATERKAVECKTLGGPVDLLGRRVGEPNPGLTRFVCASQLRRLDRQKIAKIYHFFVWKSYFDMFKHCTVLWMTRNVFAFSFLFKCLFYLFLQIVKATKSVTMETDIVYASFWGRKVKSLRSDLNKNWHGTISKTFLLLDVEGDWTKAQRQPCVPVTTPRLVTDIYALGFNNEIKKK